VTTTTTTTPRGWARRRAPGGVGARRDARTPPAPRARPPSPAEAWRLAEAATPADPPEPPPRPTRPRIGAPDAPTPPARDDTAAKAAADAAREIAAAARARAARVRRDDDDDGGDGLMRNDASLGAGLRRVGAVGAARAMRAARASGGGVGGGAAARGGGRAGRDGGDGVSGELGGSDWAPFASVQEGTGEPFRSLEAMIHIIEQGGAYALVEAREGARWRLLSSICDYGELVGFRNRADGDRCVCGGARRRAAAAVSRRLR
jgi:hypothetical protein